MSDDADTFTRIADGWLRRAEGGLVDDPRDPGHLTKWGISQRYHPTVDVAHLTWEDAKAILRREYWEPVNGDILPPPLAACVFDAAVLQGVMAAKKTLQGCLKVEADGIIGPETLAAVRRADTMALCRRYLVRRIELLCQIGLAPFVEGWLGRCLDLYLWLQGLVEEGARP